MDRQALFSLALCANRSFSKLDVSFRCAGAVFWKAACSRCRAIGICDPGVVALRCPAWQARHSVCAGAVFVGTVVQSARFGGPEACQHWSQSFWRHSPVLVLPGCRFRGRHVTLTQQDRSRCGAVHISSTRSKPSAHFGWVESLSLWRGAHFAKAKRTLCALWVGQICGAVRILSMRNEPSAHFGWVKSLSLCILSMRSEPSAHFGWVKLLSLWRGAHFEHAK